LLSFSFLVLPVLLCSRAKRGDGVNTLDSGKMVGSVFVQDYDKPALSTKANWALILVNQDQFALVLSVGGHKVWVTKVANFARLPGTVAGWEWTTSKRRLPGSRPRGVNLEKYPSPKTVNSEFGRL